MKTTLEIPDELYRQAKIQAAHENRKMKDLVIEGLRLVLGLSKKAPSPSLQRLTKACVTVRRTVMNIGRRRCNGLMPPPQARSSPRFATRLLCEAVRCQALTPSTVPKRVKSRMFNTLQCLPTTGAGSSSYRLATR